MATPESKRRSMDAIAHRETVAHIKTFRGIRQAPVAPASPVPQAKGLAPQDIKRMAMNAISNVETLTHGRMIRATGGIAVYVARIREVDRENHRHRAPERSDNSPYKKSEGFLRE